MAKRCRFRHVEAVVNPPKSRRKVVVRVQLLCWRSLHNWVVYLMILIRESLFSEEMDNRQILDGHKAPHKIRERKGPSLGVIQKCEPHERNPCAPGLRRGHKRKPCTKKDALAEQHGTWRKIFTSSKIRTRQRSSLLLNPRRRRRSLQNYWRNENSWLNLELQCTCWAKKDLSSAEMDTLRISRTTTVATASGELQTYEEAQVYVHDLDLFVTVQLLDDTLAVLSLGKLCEENGYSYEWSKRFKTTADQKWEGILLQNGKFRTSCCSWIVVKFWYQIVFYIATAGFINCFFESRTTAKWRASTGRPARFKKKKKGEQQSGNGRPFARSSGMVRRVHRQSRGHRNARARTRFSGLRVGTPYESGIKIWKHSIYTHFPKDRNCEVCLRTKMTRALCRRPTGDAVPRATEFGDLITADHSPQRGRWISE